MRWEIGGFLRHDSGSSFQVLQELDGHYPSSITDIVMYRDLIVTTSTDCTARLWHASSFPLRTTLRHGDEVISAAVNDKNIVTVGSDGKVFVYRNTNGYPLDFVLYLGGVLFCVNSLNEDTIAVGAPQGFSSSPHCRQIYSIEDACVRRRIR